MNYILLTESNGNCPTEYNLLYEFQKWLVAYGQNAIVMDVNYAFPVDKNDIIIYPEYFPDTIIKNIPVTSTKDFYNAKNAIRYFLNQPGYLNPTQSKFCNTGLAFAYNKELSKYTNGKILTILHYEPQFNDHRLEKHYNCHWMGSESQSFFCELGKTHTKKISWPNNSSQLADLLNRTKYFFAHNNNLHVATKAKYCGCITKRIINDKIHDYKEMEIIDKEIFHAQINNFLNITYKKEKLSLSKLNEEIKERIS